MSGVGQSLATSRRFRNRGGNFGGGSAGGLGRSGDPQAVIITLRVDHRPRLVDSMTALPGTQELPVLSPRHLADDPPAAVLAVGIGAEAGALDLRRDFVHRPNLAPVRSRDRVGQSVRAQ